MTISMPAFSYGFAAVAFALLSVTIVSAWQRRHHSGPLLVASAATMAWAGAQAAFADVVVPPGYPWFVLDFAVTGVWLYFLAALLRGAVIPQSTWLLRYGGVSLAVLLILVSLSMGAAENWIMTNRTAEYLLIGLVAESLYGLVGIEHIYRNARWVQRRALKFLVLGIGLFLAYNLFFYSTSLTTGETSGVLWESRGFIVALSAILIAIFGKRSSAWSPGIFVSRKVIFYTTTLVSAIIYLVGITVVGYYIRRFHPGWGSSAQLVFLTAAVVALVVFLLSDRARARVRVFVAKHFFENKYDYREEWLRLIDTMAGSEDGMILDKRAIKALADILNVHAGILWHRTPDSTEYCAKAGWGIRHGNQCIAAEHPLVRFLIETEWIVDLREYRNDPGSHPGLDLHGLDEMFEAAAFLIPLLYEDELVGWVALGYPATESELNYEDHDLLKIAGQQIARDLAQQESSTQLSQTLQFEAFNKLTAYIMHDLKNAIAQQSLVVENADKHRRNPEFVDDSIETIRRSVVRMKRVIGHLQQGNIVFDPKVIEVNAVLQKAVTASGDRQPVPQLAGPDCAARVNVDRERFFMAICHAIRNAQDATPATGEIVITTETSNGTCRISIADNGEGMDEDFVQNRLFRPFDSTKGVEGMGIGAYQIKETIRAANGDIEVESEKGKGTVLTVVLPLADS